MLPSAYCQLIATGPDYFKVKLSLLSYKYRMAPSLQRLSMCQQHVCEIKGGRNIFKSKYFYLCNLMLLLFQFPCRCKPSLWFEFFLNYTKLTRLPLKANVVNNKKIIQHKMAQTGEHQTKTQEVPSLILSGGFFLAKSYFGISLFCHHCQLCATMGKLDWLNSVDLLYDVSDSPPSLN